MSLKDHCHCGHAKETHFEKKHSCLGVYCECRKYQLYSDPYVNEPPTQRTMRVAEAVADPFDGWGYDPVNPPDDGPPSTWPMFPAAKP